MKTYCLVAVVAVIVLLSIGGDVHADDAAAAESLFQRGKEHMDAARFSEACADFELSEKLASSVGALLNLGACYTSLGKTASAWSNFTKAAVKATREGQLTRRDYANERAAELKPILTHLELRGSTDAPPGFRMMRSGVDVTLVVGIAVPVDPGEYAFEATAPDHETWSKTIAVGGEGETVIVEIPALVVAEALDHSVAGPETVTSLDNGGASSDPVVYSDIEGDSKPGHKRRLIALGVGGVGLVATATGLAFGGIANSKFSDSKDHCDSNIVCDETGFALVEDAQSSANISTALVGVGVAALVTGVVLWFTAPSPKAAGTSNALRAVPVAGGDEFGVALIGAF